MNRNPSIGWLPVFLGCIAAGVGAAPTSDTALLLKQELGVERFSLCELKLPEKELPESFTVTVEREGKGHVLALHRFSDRSPAFQVLVQRADGKLHRIPDPASRTYRGSVAGEPGSLVGASLLPTGFSAKVLSREHGSWSVKPLRALSFDSPYGLHAVYDDLDGEPLTCGCGDLHAPADIPISFAAPAHAPRGAKDGCTLKVAEIAFDSDYEYYERKCDSDTDTCVAYVEDGLNTTNLMYSRDVKITHRLTTIVIRSDPDTDFYNTWPDASDFGAMLGAFRTEWNDNMQHIERDMAYLLTGKTNPEYGGLAWVRVVCGSYAYGMGIGGATYDGIFRHEVGHNWGAGHSCGAERRYIMCGNSISAISAYNIRVMTEFSDSLSCLDEEPYDTEPAAPFVRLDPAVMVQGQGPVPIDVLTGDTDVNCDSLRLVSFDTVSSLGAFISVVDTLNPPGGEALLYEPRSDFVGTDYFRYRITDDQGFEAAGTVLVDVAPRALVGYWPLDETDGTDAEDASGYGNDGELRDELSFTADAAAGRLGGALEFSGVDGEYVSIDDDPLLDLTRGITVAAWFRVDAFAGDGETLVAKGSSAWRLKRDGTNAALKFTCSGLGVAGGDGGNLRGTVAVDDGAWHHAAGVYDGNRIYLYVDGELDVSLPATGAIDKNSSSVRIGDNEWNGAIDDVRIYNYGLNAAAIQALYEDARVENPVPADGTIGVLPGSSLRWLAAPSADEYDVYLGTDRNAVAAATSASAEYRGRQAGTSFQADTEPGQSYYWRTDVVTGGSARRGQVYSFTTGFAFSDFTEPRLNASSYTPGAGDRELGFRTSSTPTAGADPFAGVIDTSSTPTTPVFSHRSLNATTTFDDVDLRAWDRPAVSLLLQARSTGYEAEDMLDVYITRADGNERVPLIHLDGGADLTQRAGTGYATFAAAIPPAWDSARLVVASSGNSGSGSERFDFDQISFFCYRTRPVIAFSRFAEPDAGAVSYAPGPGAAELGFRTTSTPSGGADPLVGVVEQNSPLKPRRLVHRSVNATTTFDAVDVRTRGEVRATVVLRILDTGYESDDALAVYVVNGPDRFALIDLTGGDGLDDQPRDVYVSYWAMIPSDWDEATLVLATSSDSSTGSEGFEVAAVAFEAVPAGNPCSEDEPTGTVFRRGDTNADGNVDIADAITTLTYLFGGGSAFSCMDAADANDDGKVDISDAISLLGHLFGGDGELPPPFAGCGIDPSDDIVTCQQFGPCR